MQGKETSEAEDAPCTALVVGRNIGIAFGIGGYIDGNPRGSGVRSGSRGEGRGVSVDDLRNDSVGSSQFGPVPQHGKAVIGHGLVVIRQEVRHGDTVRAGRVDDFAIHPDRIACGEETVRRRNYRVAITTGGHAEAPLPRHLGGMVRHLEHVGSR